MSAAAITSKDAFWEKVAATTSTYSPDSPIIIQGKKIAETAKKLQEEMFKSCTKSDPFAEKLFSKPPMKVLDLGAGMGVNTLPMAKAGAHVTAIDQSKELLTTFSKVSEVVRCPAKNLRLLRGDITIMKSYNGPFNLVVAIDILPYLPPITLRSTMEKIHQCLEDRGILIGTLFTTDDPLITRELMGKLGGHSYENGSDFVTQLLEYSGFTIQEIEARKEGGFRFKAEKKPIEKA